MPCKIMTLFPIIKKASENGNPVQINKMLCIFLSHKDADPFHLVSDTKADLPGKSEVSSNIFYNSSAVLGPEFLFVMEFFPRYEPEPRRGAGNRTRTCTVSHRFLRPARLPFRHARG